MIVVTVFLVVGSLILSNSHSQFHLILYFYYQKTIDWAKRQNQYQKLTMTLIPPLGASLLSQQYFDPWENPELPPISLKNLSRNLNFLERQYHIRSKSSPKLSDSPKIKSNFSNIPRTLLKQKDNRSLSSLLQNRTETQKSQIKRKKSIQGHQDQLKENVKNLYSLKRKAKFGQDFGQLRGLFPLEGKDENPFLSKNRLMTISKAVNINRRRGRTYQKLTLCPGNTREKQHFQSSLATKNPNKIL